MASDFSAGVKSSTTEELRLRNYRTSLQQKSEMEIRDLQSRHSDVMQHTSDIQQLQLDELKRGFEVQISKEAEALEEKLHQIRLSGEERLEDEKRTMDTEFQKVRTASQQKIDEYRKNSEAQIDKLRKETQVATEMLHERGKRAAKKEGVQI